MPEKLELASAQSLNNGIIFYSERHEEYVAIATIGEKNVITTKWITQKEYEKNKSKKQKIKEFNNLFISLLYDLPILIIILFLYFDKSILNMHFLFLGLFLEELWSLIRTIPTAKDTDIYKFHSAEHMICNAYEDLERIPSLEELSKYSRFCNSCGTNYSAISILSFATIFACSFIPSLLYRITITLIIILIIIRLSNLGYLNFFQIFTTIPATDRELNVAIEGLKEWLKNEEKD